MYAYEYFISCLRPDKYISQISQSESNIFKSKRLRIHNLTKPFILYNNQ